MNIQDNGNKCNRHIFSSWFALKQYPRTVNEIRRQIIWKKIYIKVGNESLFNKKLYDSGVIHLNDLLNRNNHIMHFQEFTELYGEHVNRWYFMSLIDAIPLEWKRLMRTNKREPIDPHNEGLYVKLFKCEKPVSTIKSRHVYWHIHKMSQPSCIINWNKK